MDLINVDSLSLSGIMFEVLGAFFLVLESFGKERIEKYFSYLERYSNWVTKRLDRMLLTMLPFFAVIIFGFFFQSRVAIALGLPAFIFMFIEMILIDHSTQVKNWTVKRTENKSTSPIGFILLLIGNLLQVISYIWKLA